MFPDLTDELTWPLNIYTVVLESDTLLEETGTHSIKPVPHSSEPLY